MPEKPAIDIELESCSAVITYVPLRTEVPFLDYVALPKGATVYEIKPRAALDPVREAAAALAAAGDKKTAILIPGRKFDATGTRHGQGGGWYDRFLARVPREWLRIGFCYGTQFSKEPIERMEWDQVMDIVCVVDEGSLVVYDTHIKTKV